MILIRLHGEEKKSNTILLGIGMLQMSKYWRNIFWNLPFSFLNHLKYVIRHLEFCVLKFFWSKMLRTWVKGAEILGKIKKHFSDEASLNISKYRIRNILNSFHFTYKWQKHSQIMILLFYRKCFWPKYSMLKRIIEFQRGHFAFYKIRNYLHQSPFFYYYY